MAQVPENENLTEENDYVVSKFLGRKHLRFDLVELSRDDDVATLDLTLSDRDSGSRIFRRKLLFTAPSKMRIFPWGEDMIAQTLCNYCVYESRQNYTPALRFSCPLCDCFRL